MGSSLIGAVISAMVGAALAGATLVGVVSSQTSPPDKNPVEDASQPEIDYGS